MFIWNDICSDDMGIIVEQLPPISNANERTEEIEIEGSNGHLTITNGYEGDTKEVIAHFEGDNTDRLLMWLNGAGRVIFSNQMDRYYKARISNMIPLDTVLENKLYKFPIKFRCQPFGYSLDGENVIELATPNVIYSQGTFYSEPWLKVYGQGDVNINVNNTTITLKGINDYIEIDTELMQCRKDSTNTNNKMAGNFPTLAIGENAISWTGNVNRIEIKPRWRFL